MKKIKFYDDFKEIHSTKMSKKLKIIEKVHMDFKKLENI